MKPSASNSTITKPRGIPSFLIGVVIKMLGLSLLGWFILTVWFLGQLFFKGQMAVAEKTKAMLLVNLKTIQKSSSFLTHYFIHLFYVLHHFLNSLIEPCQYFKFQWLPNLLQLISTITEIDCARLFVFLLGLPLFALILLVAITDGLVKRDIRKFQGARESTFTFHRSKNVIRILFFVPYFVTLCLPIAIHPLLILIPQFTALGFAVMLGSTYFKKYL